MSDRIRIEEPWGVHGPGANFVEISGKVRVFSGLSGPGDRLELYQDAGGHPRVESRLSEMSYVFEGNPARPREVTAHVRWSDLRAGTGRLQIQARVRYRSTLPPGFLDRVRSTAGWFVYQVSWSFSYTMDQEHVTAAVATAPHEVHARHEETRYEGPRLEDYRLEDDQLLPDMAIFQMWLKLLPPPDAASEPISIGVGGVSADVGGSTAREREGAPFTAKVYIFGRPGPPPPRIPDEVLNEVFIYFPVNRDDTNPVEWDKIERWRSALQNFRFGQPEGAHLYQAIRSGQVTIHVSGAASTPGGDRINVPLSQRRADNVALQLRRYFGDRVVTNAEGRGSAGAIAPGRNFSGDIHARIWLWRPDVERVVQGQH